MRSALFLCAALAAFQPSHAGSVEDGVMAALGNRLFPVVSSMERSGTTTPVRSMLAERDRRLARCADDAVCKLDASRWGSDEIGIVAGAAAARERSEAIRRELTGLNAILEIYGKGGVSRYPQIDGPIGKQGSERLAADVAVAALLSEVGRAETVAALDPSIGLALALLDVNNRLDAIAFEPIDGGLNADAFQHARTLDWSRYPYTAIIVLGAGPDDLTTPLSARGKLHVKVAAQRYFDGKAPFIIVSGGAVHPRDTRHVEAVEMRRALIERYKVPAHAIVIEPYARHTTTNLRNAARLLISMKAPMDRHALVLSNPRHISYVESAEFATRNQNELGYQPGKVGPRTSPFDVAFLPSQEVSRVDPLDPLDP
ncbi:YdcF family protein [Steroidobacter agaridevorans]|uniref:YdcF family protein n=1 Tax=Steroidobacter agaridevorans TaxID=2695856 RepID=UPI00137ABE31|nr:YdcF family protein [Steroidobacter agaridevorans]